MSNKLYLSWGRYFKFDSQKIEQITWQDDLLAALASKDTKFLPFGLGKSYGDSCLNDHGTLLDMKKLDRVLAFNKETGVLRCEAGMSLDAIIRMALPHGWFLPVTPGTKYITIGGAVANDVHGKNHHKHGTFGRHVLQLELIRSDGSKTICSPAQNQELLNATIGGLGLTGVISWVEIQMRAVKSHLIDSKTIKMKNIDDFFKLADEFDKEFECTVSWIDCISKGSKLGRGLFMLGNHADQAPKKPYNKFGGNPIATVPFTAPNLLLNPLTISLFNFAYFHKQLKDEVHKDVHFDSFFYPLDIVNDWNKVYGKRGFFQYQFVVPEDKKDIMVTILEKIAKTNQASCLAVLKKFGDVPSPGMLSFPKAGYTLALDFPNNGKKTLDLFRELDELVVASNGRLYPAKDSSMSSETFKLTYPQYQEFAKYIDPAFSSSFWRRVTKGE